MRVVDSFRVPYRSHPHDSPYFVTAGHVGAGLIGLGFLSVGGVALLRLLAVSFSGTVTVAGLSHNFVFAVIEAVLGLVFLSSATAPWPAKGTLVTMGLVTMVLGLVVAAEPSALGDARLGLSGAVVAIVGVAAFALGWWDGPGRRLQR